MSKPAGGNALLEMELRKLDTAWAATETHWRDRARTDFADDHLSPINQRAQLAARALRQLEDLLGEAHQQCR